MRKNKLRPKWPTWNTLKQAGNMLHHASGTCYTMHLEHVEPGIWNMWNHAGMLWDSKAGRIHLHIPPSADCFRQQDPPVHIHSSPSLCTEHCTPDPLQFQTVFPHVPLISHRQQQHVAGLHELRHTQQHSAASGLSTGARNPISLTNSHQSHHRIFAQKWCPLQNCQDWTIYMSFMCTAQLGVPDLATPAYIFKAPKNITYVHNRGCWHAPLAPVMQLVWKTRHN